MLGAAFALLVAGAGAFAQKQQVMLDKDVSVPMWPFNLSVRLPIVDLVGRYLTNYLIGRESISQR